MLELAGTSRYLHIATHGDHRSTARCAARHTDGPAHRRVAQAFEERLGERAQLGTADLEKLLRAAETRVSNATRLIVEMPDDLDLRRQRPTDQEEVRRIKTEIAAQAAAGTATYYQDIPRGRKTIAPTTGRLLTAIAEEAPERGRAVLAEVMSPQTLTPKEERPEHFIEASGSVDLTRVFVSGSSGGKLTPAAAPFRLPFVFRVIRAA